MTEKKINIENEEKEKTIGNRWRDLLEFYSNLVEDLLNKRKGLK